MEKTNLKGFCNTSKIVFASLILINSGGINSTFAVQQVTSSCHLFVVFYCGPHNKPRIRGLDPPE